MKYPFKKAGSINVMDNGVVKLAQIIEISLRMKSKVEDNADDGATGGDVGCSVV